MAAAPPQSLQKGINDRGIVNWINKLVNAQYDKVLTQLEFLLSINYFHFIAFVVVHQPTTEPSLWEAQQSGVQSACWLMDGRSKCPREESVLWWIEGSSIPLPCTSLGGYLIYMLLATTTKTYLGPRIVVPRIGILLCPSLATGLIARLHLDNLNSDQDESSWVLTTLTTRTTTGWHNDNNVEQSICFFFVHPVTMKRRRMRQYRSRFSNLWLPLSNHGYIPHSGLMYNAPLLFLAEY